MKKPMSHKTLVAILLMLSVACRNQGAEAYFENCKYGKPEAIFDASTPQIEEHSFKLRREEGIERIVFESGKELTIRQMGCDAIRQEFEFVLPGTYDKGSVRKWVEITVQEFQSLANLGANYLMFSSWAQAISGSSEQINLAESVEIQPGFYVNIDRVIGQESTTLLVTLSEKP